MVLRCANIEKSKEFYEKLSLSFVKEQHGKGAVHYATKLGDLVLELYPLGDNAMDNIRLGFMLSSKEILKEANIEIVSEYTFEDAITYVIIDPDGRKIEIQEQKTC